LIVFCLLIVVVCASKDAPMLFPQAEALWKEFIGKYQKQYSTIEATYRFPIFKANLDIIDKLNQDDPTASFGITKFADLTAAEFSNFYLMPNYKPAFSADMYKPVVSSQVSLPDNFDWRDKNVVTAVKDQGQCGSCWAFSVIEEIESQWIMKNHAAVALAPQQIVDCDKTDSGCGGGDTPTAYQYVIKAGGLEPESAYPYMAKNEKCAFSQAAVAVSITSWQYVVKNKNETEMLSALYNAGPLSICVDAEPWQHYTSGILSKKCGQSLDHCVQLVGYGVDNSTAFWNIRNSWGTSWGEAGYIRVERDHKSLCGVANEVTVAVI